MMATACPERAPIVPVGPPSAARIEATVDRPHPRAGEAITHTTSVFFPDGVTVEIDALPPAAGLTLVDFERPAREQVVGPGGEGARLVERRVARLRCDEPGQHVLPRARAHVRAADDPGAAPHLLEGPDITVEVGPYLPAADLQGDLVDLDPLEPVRLWPQRLLWAGAAAALLGLVAAGLLWRRARARRRPAPPPPPPPPAEEVATLALTRARALIGDGPGQGRALSFALSEAVRAYVEARWGVNATDLTYEEIVARLGGTLPLDGDAARALRDLLRQTDAAKFARWQPDRAAQEALLEASLALVAQGRSRAPDPA